MYGCEIVWPASIGRAVVVRELAQLGRQERLAGDGLHGRGDARCSISRGPVLDLQGEHACACRVGSHHADAALTRRGPRRWPAPIQIAMAARSQRELGIDQTQSRSEFHLIVIMR